MPWVSKPSFKTLLRLGSWLAAWVVVLNITLYAASHAALLNWIPDRQTGVGFALDNNQRVQSAENAYKTGTVSPDKMLGAVVGISNTREAIDLDLLNQELGGRWRFIGIAGAGANARSIAEDAQILQKSALRPDLVILGITPQLMLESVSTGDFRTPAPTLYARLKADIKPAIWLSARRTDVSVSTERALLTARAKIFSFFGVRLRTADTASPWRSMLRVMGAEHYSESVLRGGLAVAQSTGDFDLHSFQGMHDAPLLLGSTIRAFAERGARVVVILTPEHSWLRSREPAAAPELIAKSLRAASGLQSLQVLDYRNAVADAGMVDLIHVNASGSQKFTALLIRQIQSGEWDQTPLMMSERVKSSGAGLRSNATGFGVAG